MWPDAPIGLFNDVPDPARLLADVAVHWPRLARRAVVVLGVKSDPRILVGVPASLAYVRTCWLRYARFEELIPDNPARLPRGKLPRAGRGKRERFTREELVALCTDDRIDVHRRVFYALMALTGMRCGEASGRRWRDYETDATPLGALRCWSQYEDEPLKTSEDDYVAERLIPVHPELARALATWRLRDFVELYGVHPRASDWIAADPRTGAPRTQNQAHKALRRDCARIGITERGTHAFRHAFVSLARSDGARKDVLEAVTHNAAGDVIDGYTSWEWAARCEAVSALKVELVRGVVVPIRAER